MKAFVRVVETGTFTKASETLDIPKPTVTRLIQTLEAELDTKLLNRTTRKVSVTTDGARTTSALYVCLMSLKNLKASCPGLRAIPRDGCGSIFQFRSGWE